MWIGISFAAILLLVFLGCRFLFDGGIRSSPGDFRLTIIHILLVAYSASAYVYLLSAATRAATDLAPVINHEPQWQTIIDRVGTHLWWGLACAGCLGILVDVYATVNTTQDSDPWVWQQTSFDARWMRVLGVLFCWWMGCFLYVLVVESMRLSQLAESIGSIDLLDLSPYQPLINQGLTNALLVVGAASFLSLFLLEPGFVVLMIQISIVYAIFAWIGLMLPLHGIRSKIRAAKEEEFAWCQQELKVARTRLKSGVGEAQSIAEMIAYRSIVENIRNWPFDSPSLTRFLLYLLIPICSMIGGALVERGLDFFFP
ncbi:MAG: hypothetical protein CMQ20_08405 [Gammaproteobacteria bacterium]|jgi:hypothetical protein|nr:hypothetical protein [Gammaproteobacteria bacterium]|tara:strand:+ start:1818 stop:2759 length:942 start_codon:yes stop_codon:yes gene_type:complete